nr:universal stress protein [Chitinophagales bacterium]
MKKLLVPVDFSDYTWSTVTAALDLAARIDAEVRLLHVFDDPFVESDLDDTTIRNAVSRYTENLLHKMETDAKTQMADLKTKIDGYQADRKLSVSV